VTLFLFPQLIDDVRILKRNIRTWNIGLSRAAKQCGVHGVCVSLNNIRQLRSDTKRDKVREGGGMSELDTCH